MKHARMPLLLVGAVFLSAGVMVTSVRGAQVRPLALELSPTELHPGDIIRVQTRVPAKTRSGEVRLAGRRFPGFIDGGKFVAYVGIDLGTSPGAAELSYKIGTARGAQAVTISPKEFASESLKVAPSYTDLDKATLARVARENKVLAKIWATESPQRMWLKPFQRPLDAPLGSPFGLRRIFNGQPRSPHSGLDLKAPAGAPIFASNKGKVVLAHNLFFTGNTVILDHGLGLYTIYAHLSRIDVKEGQVVERTWPIGLVGATGRVTGPHLHWAAKLGGARVDPRMLPGVSM